MSLRADAENGLNEREKTETDMNFVSAIDKEKTEGAQVSYGLRSICNNAEEGEDGTCHREGEAFN